MKKLTALAAGAALACSINLAAPPPAMAAANDEVEFCRTLVEAEVFGSLGECVGTLRSNPAKTCKNYDTDPFLQFLNFRNRGECVKFFRSIT